MRLDHLSYAAGPDGLAGTTARLAEALGEKFRDGGVHPRFGTRNRVLPLVGGLYVEVVEVLDHPASDKALFGQAVRDRSLAGGGWLAWVVAVDDIRPIERRLGRESVEGHRHRPDGVGLRWRQIGLRDVRADPQLPYFVQWLVDPHDHPSGGATGDVALDRVEIAGDSERVAHWLDRPAESLAGGVTIDWLPPRDAPGVVAADFRTPDGTVRI